MANGRNTTPLPIDLGSSNALQGLMAGAQMRKLLGQEDAGLTASGLPRGLGSTLAGRRDREEERAWQSSENELNRQFQGEQAGLQREFTAQEAEKTRTADREGRAQEYDLRAGLMEFTEKIKTANSGAEIVAYAQNIRKAMQQEGFSEEETTKTIQDLLKAAASGQSAQVAEVIARTEKTRAESKRLEQQTQFEKDYHQFKLTEFMTDADYKQALTGLTKAQTAQMEQATEFAFEMEPYKQELVKEEVTKLQETIKEIRANTKLLTAKTQGLEKEDAIPVMDRLKAAQQLLNSQIRRAGAAADDVAEMEYELTQLKGSPAQAKRYATRIKTLEKAIPKARQRLSSAMNDVESTNRWLTDSLDLPQSQPEPEGGEPPKGDGAGAEETAGLSPDMKKWDDLAKGTPPPKEPKLPKGDIPRMRLNLRRRGRNDDED